MDPLWKHQHHICSKLIVVDEAFQKKVAQVRIKIPHWTFYSRTQLSFLRITLKSRASLMFCKCHRGCEKNISHMIYWRTEKIHLKMTSAQSKEDFGNRINIFNVDVMVIGINKCKGHGYAIGVAIWNVADPFSTLWWLESQLVNTPWFQ